MKLCPSCGEEVPDVATRCKHCFHDFSDEPIRQRSGPLGLLILIVAMVTVGTGVFWYVHTQVAAERIVVEVETRSIIITRKSASGTQSNRVGFDTIARVEHVQGGDDALYEVVAVSTDGDRYILKASADTPLTGQAEYVAKTMDKPYKSVNNIKVIGGE